MCDQRPTRYLRSMANLVPKHLVDKNGVPTTRMVRPDQERAASAPLPAPVVAAAPRSDAEAIVGIVADWVEDKSADGLERLALNLDAKLGARGVREIHDRVTKLPEEDAAVLGSQLADVLNRKEFASFRLRSLHTLIDAIPVARKFADADVSAFLQKEMPMISAMGDVNGIRLGNTDPEEDRRGIGYLTFLRCTNSSPAKVYFHNMKEDAQWFEVNADALIPHAGMLRKRDGTDTGFLKELVRGDSVIPLADGML
jgi:hypothetical protein